MTGFFVVVYFLCIVWSKNEKWIFNTILYRCFLEWTTRSHLWNTPREVTLLGVTFETRHLLLHCAIVPIRNICNLIFMLCVSGRTFHVSHATVHVPHGSLFVASFEWRHSSWHFQSVSFSLCSFLIFSWHLLWLFLWFTNILLITWCCTKCFLNLFSSVAILQLSFQKSVSLSL